jgi:hypothetical protein
MYVLKLALQCLFLFSFGRHVKISYMERSVTHRTSEVNKNKITEGYHSNLEPPLSNHKTNGVLMFKPNIL